MKIKARPNEMIMPRALTRDIYEVLRLIARRQHYGLLFLPLEWPEFNKRASQYFRALCSERVG